MWKATIRVTLECCKSNCEDLSIQTFKTKQKINKLFLEKQKFIQKRKYRHYIEYLTQQ